MAEKEYKSSDLCHIMIEKVENGYKDCCQYDSEQSLSQKAGWVPCAPYERKEYVEKTKDAVLKRLKEIL